MSEGRNELYLRLLDGPVSPETATELIDAYAHELAEKQRAWLGDLSSRSALERHGAYAVPDLIDPEVST